MSDYEYDIPMPENYRQILLKMVDLSEKVQATTGDILITGDNTHYFSVGEEGWVDNDIRGRPMNSFDCFGLVKIYEKTNTKEFFTLTPKAIKWAAYQRKSRLGKWWARLSGNVKDVMLAISFLLALGLTVLQILQALKVLPAP